MPDTDEVATLFDVAADVEGVPVLRGPDRRTAAEEPVSVVGRKVRAKSSLLRVLATLVGARRTGTTAFWVSLWEPRLSGHGSRWVGHSPALYPRLTLLENCPLWSDSSGGRTVRWETRSRRSVWDAHAGLDVTSTGLVEAVVERVYHRGGASLVVSHDHWWLGGVTHRIVEITAVRSDGERTTMWRAL